MITNKNIGPNLWKYLKKYGWSIWLGLGLTILFDAHLYDLRWWIFSIPLIILVEISKLSKSSKKEEINKGDGSFFVGKKTHKF